MRRRLPHEPEQLIAELTSWIEWRYADSSEQLVLTSAPSSIPSVLERWMPGAVWRLAWLQTGAAILYGLAPGSGPRRYFIVRHDAVHARREGIFQSFPDGNWQLIEGDDLKIDAVSKQQAVAGSANLRGSWRRRSSPEPRTRQARHDHPARAKRRRRNRA